MGITLSTYAGMGLSFLFTFIFGFWVSRSGRPYLRTLFTIHKLIALAAVILLAATVHRFGPPAILGPAQTASWAIAALVVAGLFATGALMSIDASAGQGHFGSAVRTGLVTTHRILPYLAVLSTGAGLYLLTQ